MPHVIKAAELAPQVFFQITLLLTFSSFSFEATVLLDIEFVTRPLENSSMSIAGGSVIPFGATLCTQVFLAL